MFCRGEKGFLAPTRTTLRLDNSRHEVVQEEMLDISVMSDACSKIELGVERSGIDASINGSASHLGLRPSEYASLADVCLGLGFRA